MKPKRCTAQYPFTGTFQNGHRCTLEVGHTGNHTIIPPSGMDYAPDWEPGIEPPTERDDKFQTIRHFAMKIASRMHDGECPSYYDKVQFIEGQVNWLYTTISELRDQKMALLLIVDDCHRIMEERANENDKLHDLRRAINEALIDAGMEAGDREVTLRNVRSLVCEINEGRERIENLQAAIRHANASILDYDDTEWERWNDLPGVRDALEVGP